MANGNFKFELGITVKDMITGLTGVIMCRTEYLTGCRHYSLQQREVKKDGKTPDWESFDESRIVVVDSKKVETAPVKEPGGPAPEPEEH